MMPNSQFDAVVRQYYRSAWDRWPSSGSRAGLVEYDDRLETPSADLFADQVADLTNTRQLIESIDVPPAGTLDALDRQTFLAHIDQELLALERIQHWRTDPIEPIESAIGSVFGLLMRRDVGLPETAESIRRRLVAFPVYLGAALRNIERPIRMWVTAARPTAEGGIEFLREAIPLLAARHPNLESGLNQATQIACDALRESVEWLATADRAVLPDDPSVGADILGQIVRVGHGLTESLDQLDALAGRELERCKRDLAAVASQIDRDRTWQQILEAGRYTFASVPHDLMTEYRTATFGLRDRLVADGILDLPPGEVCEVISTPAFLRSVIPSAAYSSPGPLDAIQRGIFYVTEPAATLASEEFRANLGQHFCFESTCAHEAYPGHHVQLCWANHATSLARQMAHHIIFMEGWTLYCEQLMLELGYLATPIWQLDCLLSQLWRACRIRIDVRVQSRTMSVREAIDFLKQELGFTELRAETELNWYTQSPGTPMSYLLGRHETFALRDLYLNRHRGSSLRDFHNWLLKFGSIPQRWLHQFVTTQPINS